MFIAVDGIDGAGKTTLVERLASFLRQKGCEPVVTKEPTGESHWGRELRRAAREGRLSKEDEISYFHQDRLHHIKEVIQPALGQNKIVITDRYVDSTLAYQSENLAEADKLYQRFRREGVLVPDVTLILCCPIETGLARIAKRGNGDKSTFETTKTLEKARAIFESRRGRNYVRVDALGDADSSFNQALAALRQRTTLFREPIAREGNCKIGDPMPATAKRKAVG